MAENTKTYRTFNRDGSDNLDKRGTARPFKDLYHFLLSISWLKFFILLIVCFILINLFFASAYFLIGARGFIGIDNKPSSDFFLDCFFFSIQTITTIGYGHISPATVLSNSVVAIEAFFGIISVALNTGLFFSRFSRPTSKIVFSDVATIAPHMGTPSLMFRMANARMNKISEANVQAVLLRDFKSPEGFSFRQQFDLPMLRSSSLVFAVSWLVIHPINEASPLYNLKPEDFKNLNFEILIAVRGFDETFSQTIHDRHSYLSEEILWNTRFADIMNRVDGKLRVDIANISKTLSL